ncbi:hypothetical protein JCM10207_004281 [Rhodosporidiobolus poonsookiae]
MGASTVSTGSSPSRREKLERKRENGVVSHETAGQIDEENQVDLGELVDGVFGQQGAGHVNYRSVGWFSSSVLMMKAQIGLGVLSLPATFHTLGLGPGVIAIIVTAILSTWSDYYLGGPWKQNHPETYSLSDCGMILFGPIGREVFGAGYWLLMTLIAGSAILGLSTALNAISIHGTCTAVFVVVSAIAIYPVASLRTLGTVKWVGWVGLASMIVSILLVTIAVGAGNRPSPAPQEGPWEKGIVMWGNPTFADAMNAISNIVFSYAGTAGFLPIASEMRNPRDYPKAIFLCQGFVTAFYITVGVVVYMYAGQYVASPALGTAGLLIKRVAYGLALPGLLAAGVIYTHLPAKWIFVRVLRNSRHLTESTAIHWMTWLGCTFGCILFSYIIASAVPVFGGLVGLVGALFGSAFTFQCIAMLWFYDQYKHKRTLHGWKFAAMWVFACLVTAIGWFVTVAGTYGSVVAIKNDYAANGGRPFTCADNSGSVKSE